MTESQTPQTTGSAEDFDQDAGPTWTAPPGERPDGGASGEDSGGRAGSADAADADAAEAGDPQP